MSGFWPPPTNPWRHAVQEGTFREDLFYRLNVITIHIPPLRERREEIPVFLDFFLRKYSEFYGKQPPPFSDFAIGRMMEYSWPGNIRELENLVKRYVIVGNEAQIIRELSTHKPIVSSIAGASPVAACESKSGDETADQSPAIPITSRRQMAPKPTRLRCGDWPARGHDGRAGGHRAGLTQTRWNRRQAAKILKISYKALLNKLKIIEEQNATRIRT